MSQDTALLQMVTRNVEEGLSERRLRPAMSENQYGAPQADDANETEAETHAWASHVTSASVAKTLAEDEIDDVGLTGIVKEGLA
ncbi:unnamed protein product [Parascedosporium putredinis]|uniref:Uncharacterized protein n=1 Tax=Parascedosporium putredinis TaxID=1442378 RepID=A0A9P1GXX7_9PEZI|nr:unnamed protein product [Parascedosporium putredinis]CAI7990223.1 unnamed protein product [Parascedosporium putredinis]